MGMSGWVCWSCPRSAPGGFTTRLATLAHWYQTGGVMARPRLACPRLACPRLAGPRLACPRLACPRLARPRLACPWLARRARGARSPRAQRPLFDGSKQAERSSDRRTGRDVARAQRPLFDGSKQAERSSDRRTARDAARARPAGLGGYVRPFGAHASRWFRLVGTIRQVPAREEEPERCETSINSSAPAGGSGTGMRERHRHAGSAPTAPRGPRI